MLFSLCRVGFKIKQQMKEEDLYKDRDSQIAAIQATFERAKQPVCFVPLHSLCGMFFRNKNTDSALLLYVELVYYVYHLLFYKKHFPHKKVKSLLPFSE